MSAALDKSIPQAMKKIAEMFADHCINGKQINGLTKEKAACGQFIGDNAKEREQRGLHGTAAAIRVLSQENLDGSEKLIPKLIAYIRDELSNNNSNNEHDYNNVIKLSEILYALAFVKTCQCNIDDLKIDIAKKLLSSRIEDKGWSYFIGSNGPYDILPTAFAILALCKHGYENEIAKQIEILQYKVLGKFDNKTGQIYETSVQLFSIFVLSFCKDKYIKEDEEKIKYAFTKFWEKHEPLLDNDLEQNIEYWKGEKNCYIRIPWQLYLLALISRFRPHLLWSYYARKRIESILDSVNSSAFIYPYSGDKISSRTNAILYDIFDKLKNSAKNNIKYILFSKWEQIKIHISKPFYSIIILAILIAVFGAIIYSWFKNEAKIYHIAPELMGSCLVFLMGFILGKLRKDK
ncbi:MAG: hypothetical protein NTX50_31010 [Candidatus Sumerlaeota bacterium]|nr:hypothetical protein [Candidatus Sumerlaeota bacterium]